jgi:hypothetical protein
MGFRSAPILPHHVGSGESADPALTPQTPEPRRNPETKAGRLSAFLRR